MTGISLKLWNAADLWWERAESHDGPSTFWREKQDALKDAALDVVMEITHFVGKNSFYTARLIPPNRQFSSLLIGYYSFTS